MAYQSLSHKNSTQTATHFISGHDGKYFVSLTHGSSHVTQPAMVGQAHHNPQAPLHPGQPRTLAQSTLPQPVNQTCHFLQRRQKVSSQTCQAQTNSSSSLNQSEKLMHLLMFKDSQIASLNTKINSLHSALRNISAKEKETLTQSKLLQSECDTKERENQKLLNDLASVKLGKRKMAVEKGKLESMLEGRSAKLEEMSQKAKSLEVEMESLKKTNVEIWDERRELMQKFEDLEVKCKSHSETYKAQSDSLTQVKTVLQRIEQDKKKVEAEKRKLEKSKEEAFQTVQVLKSVIQQKENRIDQLQGKMKEMTKESHKADIAICDCPDKEEQLSLKKSLREKEESEAKMGDMLAKMKSQIAYLNMEKEKARQQMIQAWESETHLRTELDSEKAERANFEKQLGKMKKLEKLKSEKSKTKSEDVEASDNAKKLLQFELLESENAKLKQQIQELESKLESNSQMANELCGKQREERCKKLYKGLMRYQVAPQHCQKVAQCVLKTLLNMSVKLPGKEFAWTAQRPPTPHVSDEEAEKVADDDDGEEEDVEEDDSADDDYHESDDSGGLSDDDEDEDSSLGVSSKEVVKSADRRKSELTDKLELYGGLWCTPTEMEDHLNKLDKKSREEAVVVQLQYRCTVLELARESKLLHSSLTGKQKPFQELKLSLLKLIKQSKAAESVEYKPTESPLLDKRTESIIQERKRMYSPGPDFPILRPRKKQSIRRTWRRVAFDCLLGKMIDHFVYASNGCRDWHRGVIVEQARSSVTIVYEFAKDCPVKLSIKDVKEDFERGDLVACEVTLEDFVGKVIENLWLMEGGVTEWWKGHVLKMGDSQGEDTEFEVAYSESKDEDFIYFVPLYKDYWCNEVRILSL